MAPPVEAGVDNVIYWTNVLWAEVPTVVVAGFKLPIANATELEPIGTQTCCYSSTLARTPPGVTAPTVFSKVAPANGHV